MGVVDGLRGPRENQDETHVGDYRRNRQGCPFPMLIWTDDLWLLMAFTMPGMEMLHVCPVILQLQSEESGRRMQASCFRQYSAWPSPRGKWRFNPHRSVPLAEVSVFRTQVFTAPGIRFARGSARFPGSSLCNLLLGGSFLGCLGRSVLDCGTIDQQAFGRGAALLQRLSKPQRALATT